MTLRSHSVMGPDVNYRYFYAHGAVRYPGYEILYPYIDIGPSEDPENHLPLSTVGGFQVSYTSDAMELDAGRVVSMDLIFFKGKAHIRPSPPVYRLPKRKQLVMPGILPFIPGVFHYPPRGPAESKESFLRRKELARLSFIISEVSRERRFKAAAGRIRANYNAKVQRREFFRARYAVVFARRVKKYHRRLELFESRLQLLLSSKHKAKSARNTFHDHSLVYFKGVRLSHAVMATSGWSPLPDNSWQVSYSIYQPSSPRIDLSSQFSAGVLSQDWASRAFPADRLNYLRSRISQSVISKLKSQDFHAGNSLAQYKQTIELVHDALKAIRRFISSPVRELVRQLSNLEHPVAMANITLAVTFGVEPLISDLKGLYKLLTTPGALPQKCGKVSVRSGHSTPYRGPINVGSIRVSVDGVLTVRRVYHYDVENALLVSLNRLGLLNPAEIAWELLPWSFVIDWFFKVGEIMSSLTAEVGLSRRPDCSETISFRGVVLDLPEEGVSSLPPDVSRWEDIWKTTGRWPDGLELPLITSVSTSGTVHLKQRRKLIDNEPFAWDSTAVIPEFGFHRLAETAALTTQQLKRLFQAPKPNRR